MGSSPPAAYLVVKDGTGSGRKVAIHDRLFVGRECTGIDEEHRLLIEDPAVSRHHLEVRLDHENDQAHVVDISTNGTRLNGVRIGRAHPAPLRPGDRITVGGVQLEFCSERFRGGNLAVPPERSTIKDVSLTRLVMVVGDIVGYSAISQRTDEGVLLENLDRLYGELNALLPRFRGTLNNYAGDAFFAIWECDADPDAAEHAVNFALAAAERMRTLALHLDLRSADGEPIRMGWGVVMGPAAMSSLTGMLVTVLGDATNVAFRIAGLAARDGRADVLAIRAVYDLVAPQFAFDPPEQVEVKGRAGVEEVFGALRARRPPSGEAKPR